MSFNGSDFRRKKHIPKGTPWPINDEPKPKPPWTWDCRRVTGDFAWRHVDVAPKPNIMRRPKFQLRAFDKVFRDAGMVHHSHLGFTLRIFGSFYGKVVHSPVFSTQGVLCCCVLKIVGLTWGGNRILRVQYNNDSMKKRFRNLHHSLAGTLVLWLSFTTYHRKYA